MAAPLLTLRGISLHLGDRALFHGLDLTVQPTERACLIGRNGAGKSTLMKIAAGLVEPDGGERHVSTRAKIAYLPQDPTPKTDRLKTYLAQGLGPGQATETHKVAAVLEELGLSGNTDPARLSGGELRQASIARAFLGDPDLLLMDEPTNHLDLNGIAGLERDLAAYTGAIITISHDRAFLETVSKRCLWLDRGRLIAVPYGYDRFANWAEQYLAEEEAAAHKLKKQIAEETRWSREGISARRKRNQGRLRRLHALRQEWSARQAPIANVQADMAPAATSGKQVIEAKEIEKHYEGRPIIRPFSTRIVRGDRVGIIGPNGAGKTTLMRLLIGELSPDQGQVRLGMGLEPLVIDQKRQALDPNSTPWETLTGGSADHVIDKGKSRHVLAYLKDFLFDPAQAKSPVHTLSGGEKNRLSLARELLKPANLIVLDEPTNDLDLETLDVLEDMLSAFKGTLILISHDRRFLDNLVTSTLWLSGEGTVEAWAGGYSDRMQPLRQTAPKSKNRKADLASAEPVKKRAIKLSYKEQSALEYLPDEIAALEAKIKKAQKAVTLFDHQTQDPALFTKVTALLQNLESQLQQKETLWLELEEKRERAASL